MNFASQLASANIAGLFELDKRGTIIYSRLRCGNQLINTMPQFVGQNFFEAVARFENAGEFRRIFYNFADSQEIADNFVFDCRFSAKEIVPVRVMMLRAYENGCFEPANIIILDIRKNQA